MLMNKWRHLLLLVGLGFSVMMYLISDFYRYTISPTSSNPDNIFVMIESNQKFPDMLEKLNRSGVITDPFKFKILARIQDADKRIKAGEYCLSPSMTPSEILDILISGRVVFHRITIPEGYNIRQIAGLAAATGFFTESDFLTAAHDASLIRDKEIAANNFEGYLFPDTYHFPRNITVQQLIRLMVDRFWAVFTPEWKQRATDIGLSVHQVVTLASMIEKETGAASERPIISSVFHNRLKRRMRLESDPTVIYGIKDYNGNITREHLRTPTPYNTYQIDGLPPGPIASPGKDSLHAALFPAETPYLYFVSKGDRSHEFSTNLQDHNRAVNQYQR